jgi:hypothetical protein
MKETAVEWLLENLNSEPYSEEEFNYNSDCWDKALEMEKEQIKDAFVECWKSNVPDGIECKLDAEQYYNKTYKS